ncbi:MAG: ACP S-malonyltransferase [Eubacterium sp.]|nr:ACP S-malonyltransferase [Eubacterium sp.]
MSNKEKTAFLFSGQGSQYPGMGKEFYDNIPACKAILDTAEQVLGFQLSELMFNAEPAELAQTTVSQPAILAVSLMALTAAREKGIDAAAVAGHSLGEYAAMTACGMLTVEEAFKAIKLRSEAMDKAAKANPGCMAAVMGLSADVIGATCDEIAAGGDYVCAVNYNSNAQTVIAGTADGIAKAEAALKEKGAKRVVPLAVSAAFHSKLMESAAVEFKEKIADFQFKAPDRAFYCNLHGTRLTDFSDMPEYLSRHICSPVRFTAELNAMKADGIDTFIELGPGKVLTGLVKKTLDEVTAVNVENIDTLSAVE